jgi:hypothetical protein
MRNRAGDQHRYLSAEYFEADGELRHKHNDIVITDEVLVLQYTRSASMDRRTMRRLDHSEKSPKRAVPRNKMVQNPIRSCNFR